jgi:ElaB/YqjD/DUF883 family membrane-anchored ribosome-binding protein
MDFHRLLVEMRFQCVVGIRQGWQSKDTTSEHLRAELKSLADTLEEVLNTSSDKSKEELSKLRSKAESALKDSRYRLGETVG